MECHSKLKKLSVSNSSTMENERVSKRIKYQNNSLDDSHQGLLYRILDENEPFDELLGKLNEINYEDLPLSFLKNFIRDSSQVSDSTSFFNFKICTTSTNATHLNNIFGTRITNYANCKRDLGRYRRMPRRSI